MTKEQFIAFLRSKLNNRWWEMHGESIERQIDKYTAAVKADAISMLQEDQKVNGHG